LENFSHFQLAAVFASLPLSAAAPNDRHSAQTTNTIQGMQLREINFFLVALGKNWNIHNNREIYPFVLFPTAQSVWRLIKSLN